MRRCEVSVLGRSELASCQGNGKTTHVDRVDHSLHILADQAEQRDKVARDRILRRDPASLAISARQLLQQLDFAMGEDELNLIGTTRFAICRKYDRSAKLGSKMKAELTDGGRCGQVERRIQDAMLPFLDCLRGRLFDELHVRLEGGVVRFGDRLTLVKSTEDLAESTEGCSVSHNMANDQTQHGFLASLDVRHVGHLDAEECSFLGVGGGIELSDIDRVGVRSERGLNDGWCGKGR